MVKKSLLVNAAETESLIVGGFIIYWSEILYNWGKKYHLREAAEKENH